ncbi:MAG: S8 family peptidase [Prevotella sp.]|nr:S8 family peptidase [Prevotella sp.]
MYLSAIEIADANREALDLDERYKASGCYLEMSISDKTIKFNSLDNSQGTKLMNIKRKRDKDSEYVSATLFLPSKNKKWLEKRLDEYLDTTNDSNHDNAKNSKLIDSIDYILPSSASNLFTDDQDKAKFEKYPQNEPFFCEIWINNSDEDFNELAFFEKLDVLNIKYNKHYYRFVETIVVLINGTRKNLGKLISSVDKISELRLFKQASILLAADKIEQKAWVDLIQLCTERHSPMIRVGIIDSGINNSHPLITDFLPIERCHYVTGSNALDTRNHGSLLAGLVQYGDLTDVIHSTNKIIVFTDLTSVKIMPGNNEAPNKKSLYGVIAEEAIYTARDDNAEILCSAITAANECLNAEPSSWSGAIDETLFNGGKADSILCLSAGNVEQTDGVQYPGFNINSRINDPSQSWNAITVGAYTEKCMLRDQRYANLHPIAPKGGLSPYSRTSMLWDNGLIKPEILMEGGNAIELFDNRLDYPDDLILTSTSGKCPNRYFDGIYATSAATALAARLAAKIKYHNPTLSALSIRALMIHSAEWTDEMKRQNINENGSLNVHALLHTYGYGVPIERLAIASEDCHVTFVVEQILTPLVQGSKGKYKLNAMHMITLPWPSEILEQMGSKIVTLRITLSYYIQPSPGSRTRESSYKYCSLGLQFEIIRPTESEVEFISRVSHISTENTVRSSVNGTPSWGIGAKERNNGSVISDFIKDSAADIASCNKIAIYPTTGWWKDRKYKGDKSIKYSLVVSLETDETEIYNYIAEKYTIKM